MLEWERVRASLVRCKVEMSSSGREREVRIADVVLCREVRKAMYSRNGDESGRVVKHEAKR